MSLLSHASQEKFSPVKVTIPTHQVYFRNVTVEYGCKPICSLYCSCSFLFLTVCTRAWKTMPIQQYAGLLCKPVIVFAINIVLQNLFAEISNSTQLHVQMLRKV